MEDKQKDDNFWQRILKSTWFARLVNLPGISWFVARGASVLVGDQLETSHPTAQSYYTDSPRTEDSVPFILRQGQQGQLARIVYSVVNDLGYVAAFLALYEQGDVLPIHAFHIRYDLISHQRINEIEKRISDMMNQKMSLGDPEVARVYLYDEDHAKNLSIRAVKAGKPVIDKELFSLFTPIVPDVSRPIFKGIQDTLGIQEVVAVPFTIDYYSTSLDDTRPDVPGEPAPISYTREIVGNLFAVSTEKITAQKINVLRAFGYQAAAAIQNSHYKKQSEITRKLISHLQHTIQTEKQTFYEIVRVIVEELDYIGAMISVSDAQNTLRIKAYRLADEAFREKPVDEWQAGLSAMTGIDVNLQRLDFMDMNLEDENIDKNLAYKVMTSEQVMTTKSIYSLFRPMLPDITRERIEDIQQDMGIENIIAIPLYSYSSSQRPFKDTNCIGVLYVASRSRGFTSQEVELLSSVGEQVGNAMVYSLSEKRRQSSERFARMAFNANASLHDLNNHIGAIGMALRFLQLPETGDNDEPYDEFLQMAKDRIEVAANLLQGLSEPFVDAPEREINPLMSINRAIEKLDMELKSNNIDCNLDAQDDIPVIIAFHEMLVQVFRIAIKRAMNAIISMDRRDGKIDITVHHLDSENMLMAQIKDNGSAMTREEINQVFDIHENWGEALVGFGLFWAHDYIQGMGGKITVDSIPQQGTTINIYIPVRLKQTKESQNSIG